MAVAQVLGHVGMPGPEMFEPPLNTNQIVIYDYPLIYSCESMEKHNQRAPMGGLPTLGRVW